MTAAQKKLALAKKTKLARMKKRKAMMSLVGKPAYSKAKRKKKI